MQCRGVGVPQPNQALEPTASSFGFAYASGGGSPPALGGQNALRTFSRDTEAIQTFPS
jgi:hypothetical protein